MIPIGIVFICVGIALLLVANKHRGVHSDMRTIDRMQISELRPGIIAEISGTAQLEPPLVAPFSKVPCAWYGYEIERYEYVSGRQGQSWHRVWRENSKKRFRIYDGTGTVAVTPAEAAIEAPQVFEHTLEPGEVFPRPEFRNLTNLITGHKARVRERAFPIGSPVYVFGSVFSSEDKLYMMRGRRPLYISSKPEEMMEQEVGRKAALFTLAGLIAMLGGITLIVLQKIL